MDTSQQIDALDRSVRDFRIDYERYFSGALDVPPTEAQQGIPTKIREIHLAIRSAADRFRLSSIEARFNSYSELFNRRLRDAEEGRAPRRSAATRPSIDPHQGVVLDVSLEDGAVRSLYDGLYRSERKSVGLERFRSYLSSQVDLIRERTGCSRVQFRVAEESGRIKLKARPIS